MPLASLRTSGRAAQLQSFATTTAHFIDEDWELTSCCLETTHFGGSHTGVRIAEKLRQATQRFNISDSAVEAVVHDQAANVELAGKPVPSSYVPILPEVQIQVLKIDKTLIL